MRDAYSIKIATEQTFCITDEITTEDILLDYTATILDDSAEEVDEEGQSQAVAGAVDFYVLRIGLALNEGLNALEACDADSQDVYEYGSAVLDEVGHVKDGLFDNFEYVGGDLLFLHKMEILPAHRGKDLGLLAASRIIDLFAEGLVICRPQPLQHVLDEEDYHFKPEMNYESFAKSKTAAKQALRKYWSRIGFKRIGRSDFYALSTATPRPKVRPRAERAERRAEWAERLTAKDSKRGRTSQ